MGDSNIPPPGPLIPGSGLYKSLQTNEFKVNHIDANDLEVDNLTSINSIFTNTVHDVVEITTLLNANTVVCTGSVTCTQTICPQMIINTGQPVDGVGITRGLYAGGSQTPFGDKLLYKAPNNFYQLITPIPGTMTFPFGGSVTNTLDNVNATGLISSETRLIMNTVTNDGVAHNYIVSKTTNTTGSYPGDGTITITIEPPVTTGSVVIEWFIDGRLKIEN
jgi:hypothetical protein